VKILDGMTLADDKALMVLSLLVEGMSIRSVERITQVHRDTIMRLLVQAGNMCESLMQHKIRGLKVGHVECDEIWGFVGMKQKPNTLRAGVTMKRWVTLGPSPRLVVTQS